VLRAVTRQLANAADADRDPDHEKNAPRRHTTKDRTAPKACPARHDLTVAPHRARGSAIEIGTALRSRPLIQQPRPSGHGHSVSGAQLHVRAPDALGSWQTQ